jgi:high-affinity iron transporter
MQRSRFIVLVTLLITLSLLPRPVTAQSLDPWSAATKIRSTMFSAQKAALAGTPDVAVEQVKAAQELYHDTVQTTIKAAAPEIDTRIEQIFADLLTPPLDGAMLAYERSYLWTLMLRGSREVVKAAIQRDDKPTARAWLLLREYRTTTRYMRPDANGTLALQAYLAGTRTSEETIAVVDVDLLDAYQTLMIEAMADAESARGHNFATKIAEQTGLVVGYFEILQHEFIEDRGQDALTQIQQITDALKAAALVNDGEKFDASLAQFRAGVRTFQAAPLPGAELALRILRVDNQIGLAALEYARGIRNGIIVVDFEYQEALASLQTALSAYSDIEPLLVVRDINGADQLLAQIKQMDAQMRKREDPQVLRDLADAAKKTLKDLTPPDFVQRISGSSDRDVVATFLNQVETSALVINYPLAETARLQAYQLAHARFTSRILGTQPDLANEIEGLFWQGTPDQAGLAALLSSYAPADQIKSVIATINTRLLLADDAVSRVQPPAYWLIPAIAGLVLFGVLRVITRVPQLRSLSLVPLTIGICVVAGIVIHALQVNGTLPITPVYGFNLPVWLGDWFGLYPTLQGTLTQLVIIGLMYIFTLFPQRSPHRVVDNKSAA